MENCCKVIREQLIICTGRTAEVKVKAEGILAIVGDESFWQKLDRYEKVTVIRLSHKILTRFTATFISIGRSKSHRHREELEMTPAEMAAKPDIELGKEKMTLCRAPARQFSHNRQVRPKAELFRVAY